MLSTPVSDCRVNPLLLTQGRSERARGELRPRALQELHPQVLYSECTAHPCNPFSTVFICLFGGVASKKPCLVFTAVSNSSGFIMELGVSKFIPREFTKLSPSPFLGS